MNAVFRAIKTVVTGAIKNMVSQVKALVPVWRTVFAVIKGIVRTFVAYFKLVFSVIKGVFKAVVAVFKGDWKGAFAAVKSIVAAFRDFFRSIFGAGGVLGGVVDFLKEKIKSALGGALDWLETKAGKLGDLLAKPFDFAGDAIGDLVGAVETLIGWLGRIKFPSPPGWMSKVPGLGWLSASAAAAAPTVTGRRLTAYGAPGVPSARAGTTTASGGGITINVTGALDPEAVARQIRRVLDGHDRRVGLAA